MFLKKSPTPQKDREQLIQNILQAGTPAGPGQGYPIISKMFNDPSVSGIKNKVSGPAQNDDTEERIQEPAEEVDLYVENENNTARREMKNELKNFGQFAEKIEIKVKRSSLQVNNSGLNSGQCSPPSLPEDYVDYTK